MRAERDAALREIGRLLDRGSRDAALTRCHALAQEHPDDWPSINALGDLYLRAGDERSAATQFRRAADHFRAEGFLSKAAALYRKVLKVGFDDHALTALVDLALEQRLLGEARQHLAELERHRRALGDAGGADACAERLERLREGGARRPDGGSAPPEPAAEGELAQRPLEAAADSAVKQTPVNPGWSAQVAETPAPPLESIFERLRDSEEQNADVAAAREHLVRAGAHMREGDEDGAVAALQEAARAPALRFKAASQLGRLYGARGALHAAVAWLERAAAAPPADEDEMSGVLFELGDALERLGDAERALRIYMKLEVHSPGYRDARVRIARLLARDEGSAG